MNKNMMICRLLLLSAELKLQSLKKRWLRSSSVIKIVKMKYKRIDIKWWRVSTSFKVHLDILPNSLHHVHDLFFRIQFHSGVYFFLFQIKSLSNRITQFTCNAIRSYLNDSRIFMFVTLGGGGFNIAQAKYYLHTPLRSYTTDNNQNRDIKYDTHAMRILNFFLDRQFRGDEQNSCWILSVNKENVITFSIFFNTAGYFWISHVFFGRRGWGGWLPGVTIVKY